MKSKSIYLEKAMDKKLAYLAIPYTHKDESMQLIRYYFANMIASRLIDMNRLIVVQIPGWKESKGVQF